jgi:hypothetical protein
MTANPPTTGRMLAALVALLVVTALEVIVVGLPVDRAARITALVGLAMTKGLVLLTAFMRMGQESRVLRAAVLIPLVVAPGFTIALMLDAAFRVVHQ